MSLNNEQIRDALVEQFIAADGEPVLISEAAKAIGTSAKKINDVILAYHSMLGTREKEVSWWDKTRYETRYRFAPAFHVERRHLIALLKQTRAAVAIHE